MKTKMNYGGGGMSVEWEKRLRSIPPTGKGRQKQVDQLCTLEQARFELLDWGRRERKEDEGDYMIFLTLQVAFFLS